GLEVRQNALPQLAVADHIQLPCCALPSFGGHPNTDLFHGSTLQLLHAANDDLAQFGFNKPSCCGALRQEKNFTLSVTSATNPPKDRDKAHCRGRRGPARHRARVLIRRRRSRRRATW